MSRASEVPVFDHPGTVVQRFPRGRPRFLSEADCHDIVQRLARYADGGGYTGVAIKSTWRGYVRWARNLVSVGGEDRDNHVEVLRDINGATNAPVWCNDISDAGLVAAVRRAERLARLNEESQDADLLQYFTPEPGATRPQLFSEATYQLDAAHRAESARQLAQSAAAAGMLSAGYIEVSAYSLALLTSWGYARYYQWTWAKFSVTVRDPTGTGSGWAGVDWPDWARIDGPALSAMALDKCLRSRHPVAVEPGRYTTILEPQAVSDFVGNIAWAFEREDNEHESMGGGDPFFKTKIGEKGFSRLGERVVDERITISADPMDPDLGFPPFDSGLDSVSPIGLLTPDVYRPVTWIKDGILTNLAYNRAFAMSLLGHDTGLPNSHAFRMSGGETSMAEMIATTKRGLLVTRFDEVRVIDSRSVLCSGYTRDGLWLIENGHITKSIKNFMFVESVLFALNNVEQLGVPQRVFCPLPTNAIWDNPYPEIVPALKIRDFSFTALSDAV